MSRVVLVVADGRSVEVRGSEAEIDGLLSRRGSVKRIRGGYLRLFFVGPGDFPANPARYYPDQDCVALDWPGYETTCRGAGAASAGLLRPPPRSLSSPPDPRRWRGSRTPARPWNPWSSR
jgi:hypothetical protein